MQKQEIFLAISREIRGSQYADSEKEEMLKALDLLYGLRRTWTKKTILQTFRAFFDQGVTHSEITLPHSNDIMRCFNMKRRPFIHTYFPEYEHLYPAVTQADRTSRSDNGDNQREH